MDYGGDLRVQDLPGIIYPTAVQYVDSSVIGIINALTPLFTLCIGLAIFRLRLTLFKGLGVLLGLLGATPVDFGRKPIRLRHHSKLCSTCCTCTSLLWNKYQRNQPKLGHLNPLAITMAMFIQLGLLGMVYLSWSPHWKLPMNDLIHSIDSTMYWQSIAAMMVLGVLALP